MGKYFSKHKEFCNPLRIEAESSEETFVITGSKKRCIEEHPNRKLPILKVQDVVLIPGQILPLHLFDAREVSLIHHVMDRDDDKTIGILTTRFVNASIGEVVSKIGCTAEVISAIDHERSDSIRVKTVGRQRFRVTKMGNQLDGNLMADVQVLTERVLPSPLDGTYLSSQRKLLNVNGHDKTPLDVSTDVQQKRGIKRKGDHLSSAHFTAWPAWVYRQYDTNYLVEQIDKKMFACGTSREAVSYRSSNPEQLSLWLAANLPLNDQLKLSLLGMDNAIQRLRCELNFLTSCTAMCCKDCHLLIANTNDVFTVRGNGDGPLAMHVNPGGVVHELITVYAVSGVKTFGFAILQDTWFPGYAWTVLECANCSAHMGWRFTRVMSLSHGPRGAPDTFWGICRSSILPAVCRKRLSETLPTENAVTEDDS